MADLSPPPLPVNLDTELRPPPPLPVSEDTELSLAAPLPVSLNTELSLVAPLPPPPPVNLDTELSLVAPLVGLDTKLSLMAPPVSLDTKLSLVAPPPFVLSDSPPPRPASLELSGAPRAGATEEALAQLSLQQLHVSEQPVDPWDAALQESLLSALELPVSARPGYSRLPGKLPNFTHKEIELDGRQLAVTLVGQGAYARVYHAAELDSARYYCLKVQPTGGRWEFYVVDELRRRLTQRDVGHQPEDVMGVQKVLEFDTGSVLWSQYEPAGSLLSVHNKLKRTSGTSDTLALLLVAEMLAVLSRVHAAGIAHGDIKPDNFLLRSGALSDLPTLETRLSEQLQQLSDDQTAAPAPLLLQLIDFGRAIDLTLLPADTTFTRVVTTSGFCCPEMREGRPWRLQPDMYGAAASAYLLLFGQYMELVKRPAGWRFKGTLKRYWHQLWSEFFPVFLNIADCATLPNLGEWRRRLLSAALGNRDLHDCLSTLALRLRER